MREKETHRPLVHRVAIALVAALSALASWLPAAAQEVTDTIALSGTPLEAMVDSLAPTDDMDTTRVIPVADRHRRSAISLAKPGPGDTLAVDRAMGSVKLFNPDPVRATWLSALCPGLGQIYNRRYWKLPIVVGAFVGLSYGTAWNNRMFQDYQRGYRDAMDDDPDTRSYMNFFPKTTRESDLDKSWLQNVLKNKRDYYRRYRDICIIGIVGVYLINIVDAYVDASLSHFDISPDLSMDVAPALLEPPGDRRPAVGLQWALHF